MLKRKQKKNHQATIQKWDYNNECCWWWWRLWSRCQLHTRTKIKRRDRVQQKKRKENEIKKKIRKWDKPINKMMNDREKFTTIIIIFSTWSVVSYMCRQFSSSRIHCSLIRSCGLMLVFNAVTATATATVCDFLFLVSIL